MENKAGWSRVSLLAVGCRLLLAAIMFALRELCARPVTEVPGMTTLSVMESAGLLKQPMVWTITCSGILALIAWRSLVSLAVGAMAALWIAFGVQCKETLNRMLLNPMYEEMWDMIENVEVFPSAWWIAGLTAAAVMIAVVMPPLFRPARLLPPVNH